MMWFWLVIAIALLFFGFVIVFGSPYVPTLRKQRQAALDELRLRPGQTLIELGCGNGSLLIEAAERGIMAIGYEINPLLAAVAYFRTRKHRSSAVVVFGNFWLTDLSRADGIFVFSVGRYMHKLDLKIQREIKKPMRVTVYGSIIPNKVYTSFKDGVYLYEYMPLAKHS